MSLNFYPCSLCYKFHVQRTKQDLKFGSFCRQECKDTFAEFFGGNLHSMRSRRVQEAIWKLHEKIEDRTKLNKSNLLLLSLIPSNFNPFSHKNDETFAPYSDYQENLPETMGQNSSARW